jgi:hypothetical protein
MCFVCQICGEIKNKTSVISENSILTALVCHFNTSQIVLSLVLLLPSQVSGVVLFLFRLGYNISDGLKDISGTNYLAWKKKDKVARIVLLSTIFNDVMFQFERYCCIKTLWNTVKFQFGGTSINSLSNLMVIRSARIIP